MTGPLLPERTHLIDLLVFRKEMARTGQRLGLPLLTLLRLTFKINSGGIRHGSLDSTTEMADYPMS